MTSVKQIGNKYSNVFRDKTGRFLDNDDFVTYIETEEEGRKAQV